MPLSRPPPAQTGTQSCDDCADVGPVSGLPAGTDNAAEPTQTAAGMNAKRYTVSAELNQVFDLAKKAEPCGIFGPEQCIRPGPRPDPAAPWDPTSGTPTDTVPANEPQPTIVGYGSPTQTAAAMHWKRQDDPAMSPGDSYSSEEMAPLPPIIAALLEGGSGISTSTKERRTPQSGDHQDGGSPNESGPDGHDSDQGQDGTSSQALAQLQSLITAMLQEVP